MKIAILLSTYNGEKYIALLLESILTQSSPDFLLYIRDDGSKDKTLAILEDYRRRDDRIVLQNEEAENLGPCQSFLWMLGQVDADLIFFADQDDIWHSDKISILTEIYANLPATASPVLMHSDLAVVASDGTAISDSFWSYQRLDPYAGMRLRNALCQNSVTGCALLINRALKDEMKKYLGSPDVIMHDWLALVLAVISGSAYAVPLSLIDYRQHENNILGAVRGDVKSKFMRKGFGGVCKSITATMRQACVVAKVSRDVPNVVRQYGALADAPSLVRKLNILRLGIRKRSMLETFFMVLLA